MLLGYTQSWARSSSI